MGRKPSPDLPAYYVVRAGALKPQISPLRFASVEMTNRLWF
jgi:hypothetical protein